MDMDTKPNSAPSMASEVSDPATFNPTTLAGVSPMDIDSIGPQQSQPITQLQNPFTWCGHPYDFENDDILKCTNAIVEECRRISMVTRTLLQAGGYKFHIYKTETERVIESIFPKASEKHQALQSMRLKISQLQEEIVTAAKFLQAVDMETKYKTLATRIDEVAPKAFMMHSFEPETKSWFLTDTGEMLYEQDDKKMMKICKDSISVHCFQFTNSCAALRNLHTAIVQFQSSITPHIMKLEKPEVKRAGSQSTSGRPRKRRATSRRDSNTSEVSGAGALANPMTATMDPGQTFFNQDPPGASPVSQAPNVLLSRGGLLLPKKNP
ncbi:hypothetical protein ABW19_dt0209713 [Dactylella cylindrospora]|nr:hypothetical protein ABW19_dt0209713 [Dactylella cylindrospora]